MKFSCWKDKVIAVTRKHLVNFVLFLSFFVHIKGLVWFLVLGIFFFYFPCSFRIEEYNKCLD
jgi:hypothetical protein